MSKEFRRLLLVIITILLLRIGLVNLYQHFVDSGGYEVFDALGLILFDALNLPVTLTVALLLLYLSTKVRRLEQSSLLKVAAWTLIAILTSLLS
ncbi:MAG: hypothetical protein IIX00_03065, partial [Tidjanibacter sp.]|nr:hypothetical protein [Tidjanibacter sp.]